MRHVSICGCGVCLLCVYILSYLADCSPQAVMTLISSSGIHLQENWSPKFKLAIQGTFSQSKWELKFTPFCYIFSWQFLPASGNSSLLTCAEDHEVRHHDASTAETLAVWACCPSRVKRLAVSPQHPYLCWSAAEDGCIRWISNTLVIINPFNSFLLYIWHKSSYRHYCVCACGLVAYIIMLYNGYV